MGLWALWVHLLLSLCIRLCFVTGSIAFGLRYHELEFGPTTLVIGLSLWAQNWTSFWTKPIAFGPIGLLALHKPLAPQEWPSTPFYEMHFGWGKPIWITNYSSNYYKNLIVLLDTKGGGIEAWVTLEEREMKIF